MRAQSDPKPSIQLPVGCLYALMAVPALVCGVFAVVGSIGVWFTAGAPAFGAVRARSWVETPCTVVESHAESASADGDSRGRMVYRYEVAGRSYQGDRYAFRAGSSHAAPADVAATHPEGSIQMCYVDPADPADAVLDRGFRRELWIGLFPGVFMVVGLGGMVAVALAARHLGSRQAAMRSARRELGGAPPRTGAALVSASMPVPVPSGVHVVEPSRSRLMAAFGLWAVALFCSTVTGVVGGGFGWAAWQGQVEAPMVGCIGLFLVPFVVICVALLYAAARQTLQLFGPRPVVTLPRAAVLGEPFAVRWQVGGPISRLRRLTVELVGREEATYRVGTSTSTDRRVFHRTVLFQADAGLRLSRGEAVVTIPAGSMHSFQSANNKVVWMLRFLGDVPHWPDVEDEFDLEVRPRPGGTR